MMRTLVEIGDAEITALDRIARKDNVSRSALIRKAIKSFLDTQRADQEKTAFGLWLEHPVDGLTHQQRLRDEW